MEFRSKYNEDWKGFHPELYSFITPFCPSYLPKSYRDKHWDKSRIDYTHEREWRVPHDFKFERNDVQFVVVPDYEAVATFPKELKEAIGRENFIIIEVYSQIEKLRPVRLL